MRKKYFHLNQNIYTIQNITKLRLKLNNAYKIMSSDI